MKRAEQIAWAALGGLVAIAAILLAGGFIYHMTAFWAGMMLAGGQALVVGIAAWGLMLARQARELEDLPAASDMGFRLEKSDDAPGSAMARGKFTREPGAAKTDDEIKTLDTGFQRVVVGCAGGLLVLLSIWAGGLVYLSFYWAKIHPDLPLPVAGTFKDPVPGIDALGVLIGLSAVAMYAALYWLSRLRIRRARGPVDESEAVRGNFSLGIGGMAFLAAATILAFFRVSYASELAGGVLAFVMAVQGLELIANSFKSYAGVEELDEQPVDLQNSPLVPMMGSVWMTGLRMIFAQSVGLSAGEKRERGVIARLMPRVLIAIAVIAIGISCLRVVQPGQVAVRERLGWAPTDDKGRLLPAGLLQPGLHLSLPWPMDNLVYIPTKQLQETNVGTEVHAPPEQGKIDFQFWQFGDNTAETQGAAEDLFLTGDMGTGAGAGASPQILETYVQVLWQVADPAQFYNALSHSDFYEKSGESTTTLPIYDAIVQQCTSFAVTRAFATHTLQDIMISNRQGVENECRQILQDKLDSLNSGIRVSFLTIKDLHPPFWHPDQHDQSQPRIGGKISITDTGISIDDDANPLDWGNVSRGPASAFEFVISMREFEQRIIALASAQSVQQINQAQSYAVNQISEAQSYTYQKVAQANGDAERLVEMTGDLDPDKRNYELQLMEMQLLYSTIQPTPGTGGVIQGPFDSVTKIVVDPAVKDVQIWQTNGAGPIPVRPPGQ